MQPLTKIVLAFFLTLTLAQSTMAQNAVPFAERSLRTEFRYKVHIGALPAGTKTLALWVPLPSSSEWQQVESINVEGMPNTSRFCAVVSSNLPRKTSSRVEKIWRFLSCAEL